MIQITVKAKILPGKETELREVANTLQYDYAANEKGCIQYESYIDGDTFLTLEKWVSREDLDAHLAADHIEQYVPKLRACVEGGVFNVDFVYGERTEQQVI